MVTPETEIDAHSLSPASFDHNADWSQCGKVTELNNDEFAVSGER